MVWELPPLTEIPWLSPERARLDLYHAYCEKWLQCLEHLSEHAYKGSHGFRSWLAPDELA